MRVIVPNRITHNFQFLRWHLLFTYLIVMIGIFGASAAALYIFFSRSIHQQLSEELVILVQAAVPTLDTVKTKGRQSLDKDLPWRNLFSHRQQSLEWFDTNGELLAREGTIFSQFPLIKKISPFQLREGSPVFQQEDGVITVTIAIYSDTSEQKTLRLAGYIRGSESTQELETALNHLRLGLAIGGAIALILITLSDVYLTQKSLEPLRQNFQQLKQFNADVSHELRNPLTRIGIATDIMLSRREEMKPSDLKKLEMIDGAVTQMRRLLEDLLFLSRTEATSTATAKSTIALDELLRDVQERFEPQAETKGISFQAQLPSGLWIKGNTGQLSRLFSNLLENALKYTEAGGNITLSLNQSRRSAVVSVEDTGIGIPYEYLPFVFQRFWSSDQPRSQQERGSGLGLAICEAIAQQHGGKIDVNSRVGVGTCFRVTLPLLTRVGF
jgi:signal transduction histidine kinase